MSSENRVCLVIGCSDYDSATLTSLPGAKNDAEKIFQLLIDPAVGNYDPNTSIILISPKREEIENAMVQITKKFRGRFATFTFFFAGHGILKDESYFLCTKNTDVDMLSLTALPVTNLFTLLNEIKFVETNIVIDACEAGGAAGDLRNLLTVERFGVARSPSINFFASAQGGEAAKESKGHGLVAEKLIGIIEGKKTLTDRTKYLDLGTIGSSIADDFRTDGRQTPTYWGISLTGQGEFVLNPHFNKKYLTPGIEINEIRKQLGGNFEAILKYRDEIIATYISLNETFSPCRLLNLIKNIRQDFGKNDVEYVEFLAGFRDGLLVKAKTSKDTMTSADVLLTFLAGSLSIDSVKDRVRFSEQTIEKLLANTSEICSEIDQQLGQKYPFIYPEDNLAALVLFPLRCFEMASFLAKLNMFRLLRGGAKEDQEYKDDLERIKKLIGNFPDGFRIVSDTQAAYLADLISLSVMSGEKILPGSFFLKVFDEMMRAKFDFLACRSDDLELSTYMAYRTSQQPELKPWKILSNPPISPLVLVLGMCMLGLDTELNSVIQKMDGRGFRIFVPDRYLAFDLPLIQDGVNFEIGIGRDCFTADDLRKIWKEKILPKIETARKDLQKTDLAACLASAHIFGDRQFFGLW